MSSVSSAAASPLLVRLWFTLLPQPRSVTVPVNVGGAVHLKLNSMMSERSPCFGVRWVISASPPRPEIACVPMANGPPVDSVPPLAATLSPP